MPLVTKCFPSRFLGSAPRQKRWAYRYLLAELVMPTRCRKSEEEDAGRRGVDELAAGFDQIRTTFATARRVRASSLSNHTA